MIRVSLQDEDEMKVPYAELDDSISVRSQTFPHLLPEVFYKVIEKTEPQLFCIVVLLYH